MTDVEYADESIDDVRHKLGVLHNGSDALTTPPAAVTAVATFVQLGWLKSLAD